MSWRYHSYTPFAPSTRALGKGRSRPSPTSASSIPSGAVLLARIVKTRCQTEHLVRRCEGVFSHLEQALNTAAPHLHLQQEPAAPSGRMEPQGPAAPNSALSPALRDSDRIS